MKIAVILALAAIASTSPVQADAADVWRSAAPMSTTRNAPSGTVLRDGRVLVSGGASEGNIARASAERFDPVSNAWSPAGSLSSGRFSHTAQLLPNSDVLIVGGLRDSNGSTAYVLNAELFNSNLGTWSAAGSLNFGRYFHTSTLLPNGKVFVAGGGSYGQDGTTEIYDPVSRAFSLGPRMLAERFSHSATLLPDGRLFVVGGQYFAGFLASTEFYDPDHNSWTLGPALADVRSRHTATRLANGEILVVGGARPSGDVVATSELYSPGSNSWRAGPRLAFARYDHTATLLPDGRVLIAGGVDVFGQGIASAEIYDPATNRFGDGGEMSTGRQFHAAVGLKDGRVLVAGGSPGSGPFALDGVEIFGDPLPLAPLDVPLGSSATWLGLAVLLGVSTILCQRTQRASDTSSA